MYSNYTIKRDAWQGCYNLGWGDLITPESYSHPAKMSRSLVFKIISHAIKEGWIIPGQMILDPFGGVGTTALPALLSGLNYIGVELEEKFVDLGRQNIDLWNERFGGKVSRWGQAVLLQGDSRRLVEVVNQAGMIISSPPYADTPTRNGKVNNAAWSDGRIRPVGLSQNNNIGYGDSAGQLGAMPPGDIAAVIGSPPFAGNTGGRGEASRNGIDAALFDRHSGGMKRGTGSDPANLDHLPQGNITSVIGSPPYADGCSHTGGADPDPEHIEGSKRGAYGVAIISSPPFADSVGSDDPTKRGGLYRDPKRAGDVNLTGSYGQSEGQLGAMKAGEVAAVITSPPYETGGNHQHQMDAWNTNGRGQLGHSGGYADETNGQLQGHGETFWSAARLIVEQCAAILPPGGHAIWVVKNFVKNKHIMPFSAQWQQLCEACGFQTIHIHRAMLIKENGQQVTLDGSEINLNVERKSFFRRLAEQKGSPRIDWETVLCMVRQ